MDKHTADAFCRLLAHARAIHIANMLRADGPGPAQWREFVDAIDNADAFLIERGVLCAACEGCAKDDDDVDCAACGGKGRLI